MKKSATWEDLELFLIWKINIKTPHNTFVLTPFHSFNSFNSRFISLPFTPSTPLTPKKKQWKINIKRPFPTSW